MKVTWSGILSPELYHEFQGRGVIVAGGATGIGEAIADGLHYLGAKVAIIDRTKDAAAQVADRLASRVPAGKWAVYKPIAIGADLTNGDERKRALTEACSANGAPYAFISTIGLDQRVSFDDVDDDTLVHLMKVNYFAPMLTARELLKPMREGGGGAMCLFTSRHGSEINEPGMIGYGSAKAALDHGIQVLAQAAGEGNTADNRIRVFGVCPGWVQTENQKRRFPAEVFAKAAEQALLPIPMNAAGIVSPVIHTLSRHSSYITGTTLRIDGGEDRINRASAVSLGAKPA